MTVSAAADFILARVGKDLRVAAPLGLGKPNQLLNEIFDRAAADSSLSLKIYTALSLQVPAPAEDLARRFLGPFSERHWGKEYPTLNYYRAAARDQIPENIQVHEFYFQAGSALRSEHLQRHYQSVNYTHVAENIFRSGVNVIVQLVAERDGRYSLSCNPDLTLDVVEIYERSGAPLVVVGVVHPDLPFLSGEAEVAPEFFSAIVDSSQTTHKLFALPRQPVAPEEHLIGFYASLLVRDEGTLQIGIGSLSDAIVSALCLRQSGNGEYLRIKHLLDASGEDGIFVKGLYGLTEMLTDGFMHLRKAGILKRQVTDELSGAKTYLHGSFILGSEPFYDWLRNLKGEDATGLRMTRVSKVNDLYDPNESRLRQQRINPRFFNTTMQVTLLGEAMSETLSNAHVVSGVGGQYNFVAMSHELPDSRSVIMLRSTRTTHDGRRVSNIVWEPGHVTLPRHLRDVVVTEYGVADLKGKSDEDCIIAMLGIADSEFQAPLLAKAKELGKLRCDFQIPRGLSSNTPEKLAELMREEPCSRHFKPFPFGSDFTPAEERLAVALGKIQEDKKISVWRLLIRAARGGKAFPEEMSRMGLAAPRTLKEKFYRRLLAAYLTGQSGAQPS